MPRHSDWLDAVHGADARDGHRQGAIREGNPPSLRPSMATRTRPDVRPGTLRPGALRPGALRPGALRPGILRPEALRPVALRPGALQYVQEPEVRPGALRPGTSRSPTSRNPGALRPGGAYGIRRSIGSRPQARRWTSSHKRNAHLKSEGSCSTRAVGHRPGVCASPMHS